MAKLRLTLACDSFDFLQPLREGKVQAEGLDLNLITVEESGTRHYRMYHHGEYDACEFSMSSYLVAQATGIDWFQAIPFFPRRMFGHKFCFIRARSGFKRPSDLKGCKIGISSYKNTLALMVKGMLMHDYGLPLEEVKWVCVNREQIETQLPASVKIEYLEGGKKLEALLISTKLTPRWNQFCQRPGYKEEEPSNVFSRKSKKKNKPTTKRPASFPSCTPS